MIKISSTQIVKSKQILGLIQENIWGSDQILKATSTLIFTHIVQSFSSNGLDFWFVGVDIQTIYDNFEKCIVTDPLTATYSVGLLTELLKQADSTLSM